MTDHYKPDTLYRHKLSHDTEKTPLILLQDQIFPIWKSSFSQNKLLL